MAQLVDRLPQAAQGNSALLQGKDNRGAMVVSETAQGPLFLTTRSTPELVARLDFDQGLGIFWHYTKDAAQRQQNLVVKLAGDPTSNVVLAWTPQGRVVGYVLCHRPDHWDPWHGQPEAYMLGAFEVSRNFRGNRLLSAMLSVTLRDPASEEQILLCPCYAWHWDLERLRMPTYGYRKMLVRTLGRFGFDPWPGWWPDRDEHPANALLVRMGSQVAPAALTRFRDSLTRPVPADPFAPLFAPGK